MRVGRKDVAVSGESVSVLMSASWNASFIELYQWTDMRQTDKQTDRQTDVYVPWSVAIDYIRRGTDRG